MTRSQLIPTLTGSEYTSDEVFRRERAQIFHTSWFYVCRDDRLAAGDRFVADVAGESVLLVKDRDGTRARSRERVPPSRREAVRGERCRVRGPASRALTTPGRIRSTVG